MFNYLHYVPILRWKRGEQFALRGLRMQDRKQLTPLLELVPSDFQFEKRIRGKIVKVTKSPPDVDHQLVKIALNICESCSPGRIFIDLGLLDRLNPVPHSSTEGHIFEVLGREIRNCQMFLFQDAVFLTPVTGLHRPSDYQLAVKSIAAKDRRGVCLRLGIDEVNSVDFRGELDYRLSSLELEPNQIDLLVDYKIIEDSSPGIASLCNNLPYLPDWRTFTIACGVFPENLSKYDKNDQHILKRQDWQFWRDYVTNQPSALRLPSYGDYTIQHAEFIEPPLYTSPSASIRYTSEDHCVIMRGEQPTNEGAPSAEEQYRANAQLLRARKEFRDADFSTGDQYIYQLSKGIGVGRAETLLRAGINHHITMVVHQIANMSDISVVAEPLHEVDQEVLPLPAEHK